MVRSSGSVPIVCFNGRLSVGYVSHMTYLVRDMAVHFDVGTEIGGASQRCAFVNLRHFANVNTGVILPFDEPSPVSCLWTARDLSTAWSSGPKARACALLWLSSFLFIAQTGY